MTAETISERSEQPISTAEDDPQKQPKSNVDATADVDELPKGTNEPAPSSVSSNKELTNGLKRPLLASGSIDIGEIKKIRLTENSSDNLEVVSLNGKDLNKKDHIVNLLIKKHGKLTEFVKHNGDEHSDTHKDNSEKNIPINYIGDNVCNINTNGEKVNSPSKKTISKDIEDIKNNENENSNINNVINKCDTVIPQTVINSRESLKTSENEFIESNKINVENSSHLNRSSSSESLIILENSDHEDVEEVSQSTGISTAVSDSPKTKNNFNKSSTEELETENIENSTNNSLQLPMLNKHRKNIISVAENTVATDEIVENDDEFCEIIESNSSSSTSSGQESKLIGEELIDKLYKESGNLSKKSFPHFLKLLSRKDLTYDQFDSVLSKKVVEIMTDVSVMGKDRAALHLLIERERHWREKFASVNKQLKEIKAILNIFKHDLKTDKNAKPHLITRTVGLQALLFTKKEVNGVRLPSALPLCKVDKRPVVIDSDNDDNDNDDNDDVNDVNDVNDVDDVDDVDDDVDDVDDVDDDDDVIALDPVEPVKPSSSKTVENTTPKKVLEPIKPSSSKIVENTTPRKVLEPVKPSSKTNENMSPKKQLSSTYIARLSPVVLAKPVPPSTPLNPINKDLSTIDLTENDDGNDVPNGLNLEKLSPIRVVQHPSMNKGVLSRTSSTQLTSNLSTQVLSKNLAYIEIPNLPTSSSGGYLVRTTSPTVSASQLTRPYILKQGKLLPLQLSTRQLQPGAIYTTNGCQVPASHLSVSLPRAPVPPSVPIASVAIAKHPAPSPGIPKQRILKHPVPIPDIPSKKTAKHPAPFPDIPNQKSLTTWKKLPPAPLASIEKATGSDNPNALVLSWNISNDSEAAEITRYQIYAYQESVAEQPVKELWKMIGEVNALPLPMACSLTQFLNGEKYHFTVRAIDKYNRFGPFSAPQSVSLNK